MFLGVEWNIALRIYFTFGVLLCCDNSMPSKSRYKKSDACRKANKRHGSGHESRFCCDRQKFQDLLVTSNVPSRIYVLCTIR